MSSAEDPGRIAADTVAKLAGSIYADVASPAARQVGTALEAVFKIGLSPVSLLDWGFDKSKQWLVEKLAARLASTPTEHQQPPPAHKAVPLLLAIAASTDATELRTLYAELLMKAMDTRTEQDVHPSFVSVLGQMTPQEALVFMSFREKGAQSLFIDRYRPPSFSTEPSIERLFEKHCVNLGLKAASAQLTLENLLRLRLLELNTYTDATYVPPDYDRPAPSVDTRDERHLTITEYGHTLLRACAPPPATSEA